MAMEVGQVCVKLAGREAGKKCVVVDVIDKNYVLVSGPEVKRRRCNIRHLEPLEQKLKVERGTSDEDIRRALGWAKPEVRPEGKEKPPEKVEKPVELEKEKPPEERPPKQEKPEEKAPEGEREPEKVEGAPAERTEEGAGAKG